MEDLTSSQTKKLVEKYTTFLFDCDGVLWRGSEGIKGIPEMLHFLIKEQQKQVFFVTNNSSTCRADYVKKFEKFGISCITKDMIISSAFVSAWVLKEDSKLKSQKVYVYGELGICQELDEVGIPWIGGLNHSGNYSIEQCTQLEIDPDIDCVLCGIDRNINYYKLSYAHKCLENKKTKFLATNTDSTFPAQGRLLPGGGATLSPLLTASGRSLDAIIGKPSSFIFDYIQSKFNVQLESCLMVGDRLDTDIVFGKKVGISTLLVGTGLHRRESLALFENEIVPDYFLESAAELRGSEGQ